MKSKPAVLMMTLLSILTMHSSMQGQETSSTPVVYTLDSTEDASLWYMAFAETAAMRSRLGDWISISLYKSAPTSHVDWYLQKAYRKDNRCFLSVNLSGSNRKTLVQTLDWMDKGVDGKLSPTVTNDQQGGNAFISFVQQDGSTRKFWIRRSRDLDELSQNVKVTAAQPLWDWKIAPIGSL